MIKFKLNGKSLSMPSNWYDLTFDQYVKIMTPMTRAEQIAMFSGVDAETVMKAKIEGLDMVLAALSFLDTPPKFDNVIVKIGKYNLPVNSKKEFNIQFESLEQFEDMRAIMLKPIEGDVITQSIEYAKTYAKYVAIYLQKIKYIGYSMDKAITMLPEIYEMPAHEVIALGSFFFRKLLSLLSGTPKGSQNTTPNQKKKKPGLVVSRKRSARSQRSRK